MAYGEFAKIYDKLINEDIDYNNIAKIVEDLTKEYNCNNEDYLDLACGTGNVSIEIANKYKNNYLVDLSEEMLQIAFEKFKNKRIKSKFICQDMTELQLNHNFDLITCVLDSTNYILEEEDLKKYFKSVFNHLKEEGIFIFDINSFYKLTNILGNNIYTYNEEQVFYTWENTLEDNVVEMFLTFFVKNGDLYERFEEQHFERAYSEEEIEGFLKECGFKLLNKFDGYSKEPVNKNSERILYVVSKEK